MPALRIVVWKQGHVPTDRVRSCFVFGDELRIELLASRAGETVNLAALYAAKGFRTTFEKCGNLGVLANNMERLLTTGSSFLGDSGCP